MIDFEYQTVYSRRRTVSITVKPDGRVIVRAPFFTREKSVKAFVEQKRSWIEKHLKKIKTAVAVEKFDSLELREINRKANELIPQRVSEIAQAIDIKYNGIRIKTLRTLWGSCSIKGNLNFNCLLVLTPEKVMNYVIVHELCHRKEMNHSKRFWKCVENVMPDYKECNRWLKENGAKLLNKT